MVDLILRASDYYNQGGRIIDEKCFFGLGDSFFFQTQMRKHFIVALIDWISTLNTFSLPDCGKGKMKCIQVKDYLSVFAGIRYRKSWG